MQQFFKRRLVKKKEVDYIPQTNSLHMTPPKIQWKFNNNLALDPFLKQLISRFILMNSQAVMDNIFFEGALIQGYNYIKSQESKEIFLAVTYIMQDQSYIIEGTFNYSPDPENDTSDFFTNVKILQDEEIQDENSVDKNNQSPRI